MSARTKTPLPLLEEGQLWKTENTYIRIVELGRRLISYKMLRRPEQRAVATQMIGIEALAVYLRTAEATLVDQPE